MDIVKGNFNRNVFINYPLDEGYFAIRDAIVFTIIYCGFIPRCAIERDDSSEVRINKIQNMISECRYGIHDISVAGLDPHTNLARFNMPYELGLFIGCKKYGDTKQKKKSCLILDKEKFRYTKFLSDISGQDIRAHYNNPKEACKHIRNFLSQETNGKNIPSPSIVWYRYLRYQKDAPDFASSNKWKINELKFRETVELITTWLKVIDEWEKKMQTLKGLLINEVERRKNLPRKTIKG